MADRGAVCVMLYPHLCCAELLTTYILYKYTASNCLYTT